MADLLAMMASRMVSRQDQMLLKAMADDVRSGSNTPSEKFLESDFGSEVVSAVKNILEREL